MNRTLIGLFLFFGSHLLYADSIAVSTVKANIQQLTVDREQAIENLKFRPQFKETYSHLSEFNYATVEDKGGLITRLKNRIIQWLDRLFQVDIDEKPRKIWNESLNYIALVLLVVLAFYIVRAFVRKDALWFFKKSKKAFNTPVDDVELNLEQTDFKTLIAQAIDSENRRLAVRYYYLWSLKILSKKDIIKWDLEKTNSDYLAEIKHEETRISFQYLSYLYNNIWYGEFEVDPIAFKQSQQAFSDFIKPWQDE